MRAPGHSCAICHVARHAGEPWFLVLEKPQEDKLRVLEWDDRLAGLPGFLSACNAFHVQQLVAHWMTTGNLGYPMAQGKPARKRILPAPRVRPGGEEVKSPGDGRPLGELSVHRESLNRLLQEQPECLLPVLDALMSALQRSTCPDAHAATNRKEEGKTVLVPCTQ